MFSEFLFIDLFKCVLFLVQCETELVKSHFLRLTLKVDIINSSDDDANHQRQLIHNQ